MLPGFKRLRNFSDAEKQAILAQIETLRPWAYSFDFGSDIKTRQGQEPRAKFQKVLQFIPNDLGGASCLDLPSNNAQLAMLLKDRGAGRVIAIDISEVAVAQGKYLINLLGYDVDIRKGGIHDVPADIGKFDYVFCLGLIYHLQDMMGAMHKLFVWTNRECFVETEVLKIKDFNANSALFIEGRYHSDATNWWIPGIGCVMGMARAAGFKQVEIVDYWEHKETVSREGLPMQARGIFRMSLENSPLPAPRFVTQTK